MDPLGGGEDDPRSIALLIRGSVYIEYPDRDFLLQVDGQVGWCDLLSWVFQIGELGQEVY